FGPSVYFDKCIGEAFNLDPQRSSQFIHLVVPQIQISGFVEHVRIDVLLPNQFKILLSQIRFKRLDLLGEVESIQFVEYMGRELYFKKFGASYFWIRENLSAHIPYIEIDEESIKLLSSSICKKSAVSPDFVRSTE